LNHLKEMRPVLPLLLLWMLSVLASCREEAKEYAFEGMVTISGDGVPLQGVAVTLRGQRLSGTSFNPNFQTLATDVTGADGRFHLSVEKALFQSFRISLEHTSHFTLVRDISPDDVPISTPHTGIYPMEPLAWVRTRLLNANASQRIDVTVNAPSSGCDGCCDQLRVIREGEVFDTTFTCLAYGGGTVTHTGNYRNSNGGTVIVSHQNTTVAYDTISVNVSY
jgi:hypothetical protein